MRKPSIRNYVPWKLNPRLPLKHDRFIPDNLMQLREAVDLWGSKTLPNWDGSEKRARKGLLPPRPPWELVKDRTKGFLIFGDKGKRYVSKDAAEAWWAETEPHWIGEYETEKAAADRWASAVQQFRSILYEGKLDAFFHDQFNDKIRLTEEGWARSARGAFFDSGWGFIEEGPGGPESSFRREGPVVIKRSDLEAELGVSSAQRGQSTGDSPISDLDQFPFLQFMLEVASLIESGEVRTHPKTELVGWLETHWPDEKIGQKTGNKIKLMATFLRRPDDAKGGNTKWKF